MFEPKPTHGESTTHANSAIFRKATGRDDRRQKSFSAHIYYKKQISKGTFKIGKTGLHINYLTTNRQGYFTGVRKKKQPD